MINKLDSVSAPEVNDEIGQIAVYLLSQGNTKEHGTPFEYSHEELLQKICSLYSDICNKTTREGTFTSEEHLYYQLLMVYLINKIDDGLIPGSIRQTLDNLIFLKDPDARRGSAGHSYVKINVAKIDSRNEFREVLSHEFGHTIDLSVLVGHTSRKHTLFTEFGKVIRPIDDPSIQYYRFSRENENVRKKESSFKDFVSGYAMKSIYEDFAEHKNAWFNHNAVFKKLAGTNAILQRKYDFFDDLYAGDYYRTNSVKADHLDTDIRERDTTKMREETEK